MESKVKHILNGVIIGSSMLIPGVSGGTSAIILGVYDKLIMAVSNLFKDFKKNFSFLLLYAIGGGGGILLFSKALLYITNNFEKPMMFLFLGAVCGSIPFLLKKAQIKEKQFSLSAIASAVVGLLLVYTLDYLPENLISFQSSMAVQDYVILFILGIILSIALVLPGISFSYMLLVLGVYQPALQAVDELHLPFLIVLGGGIIVGTLLTTRLLGFVMERFPAQTFMLIIGFVIGSLREIYPGFPNDISIIICLLMFLAGFFAIFQLSKREE